MWLPCEGVCFLCIRVLWICLPMAFIADCKCYPQCTILLHYTFQIISMYLQAVLVVFQKFFVIYLWYFFIKMYIIVVIVRSVSKDLIKRLTPTTPVKDSLNTSAKMFLYV